MDTYTTNRRNAKEADGFETMSKRASVLILKAKSKPCCAMVHTDDRHRIQRTDVRCSDLYEEPYDPEVPLSVLTRKPKYPLR
ncbi:MAG: hypothetical protein AEth_00321 [Candidatus Argoarchaeum ethanivorans]|uniref:Uncharacterized protein n=1 Tax=Candidatus Argoarchaeum ethanivorans TaxID=2608793 RepID=A0A8B6SDH5_9EURY|nr:MAG: hypothetical protein AEth_00321 [Candidatus Argoarchaeum ethanivorans]